MAKDTIIGGSKKVVAKVVKPKVVAKVASPVNEKFNQAALNQVNKTRREADAIKLANSVTDTWTLPKFNVASDTAAAPAAPSATSVYNRANTVADRGTIAPILTNYGTSANQALTDRYKNYLNALNQGNESAKGQINTATQNLLNSLPTTYKPATTPTWLQPQANANPYQQYLASTGAGTTDIGNLQQYANATAQNATNMYQGVNQAQNAIQQNYLDSLRAGASSQGAAALQALANTQAGQKAAAEQVYGTSKANILATLLPLLVSNPTKGGSDAFNIGTDPTAPVVPATPTTTNGPTDIAPDKVTIKPTTTKTPTTSKNPLANAPKNPKPNQKYNVGTNHYVWKADKKTWVKSK
jgi:hypothetical protein